LGDEDWIGDGAEQGLMDGQNGKQGDVKELNAAALQAQADAKASS
jgi:hypothetical protein